MAIARRVRESMKSSSWVRAMFETGIRLKREHGAENVCDLSLGNPDLDPPAAFHSTISDLLSEDPDGMHAYMPNGGYPEVRRAVAGYVAKEYGAAVTGDHIVMSCGAGGALNVVLKSILDPGDTVIAPTPCFMEYRAYAANHSGELVPVDGAADFDLDVDAVEAAIDSRTAAVVINSPNNPSGRVYPERTIASLGAMLEAKSKEIGRTIYLVSDEPYRKIVYGDVSVPSIFSHYRNAVVVSSYSKELSIPGERIGWIAASPDCDEVEILVDALILCTRILGYVNAPALMQRVVGRIAGCAVDIAPYKRRKELLCSRLSEMGYDLIEPDGTFYLFPKAPGGDDLAFVEALQKELVLTVPGRGFGKPGYFRIAFCVDDEVISRSLDGFETVIRRFRSDRRL